MFLCTIQICSSSYKPQQDGQSCSWTNYNGEVQVRGPNRGHLGKFLPLEKQGILPFLDLYCCTGKKKLWEKKRSFFQASFSIFIMFGGVASTQCSKMVEGSVLSGSAMVLHTIATTLWQKVDSGHSLNQNHRCFHDKQKS